MADALSPAQRDHWVRTGWLHLTDAVAPAVLSSIREAVDEIENWAGSVEGPGLHHWEMTDAGPALARSEELIEHQPVLRRFVLEGRIPSIAAALFGEPAVLFKEKVNYKQPGGAGFAPHQDAAAYRFVDHHVSCMVALDPASEASGCLSVASGRHQAALATEGGGRLTDEVVRALDWEPVESQPGDVLWFDSYTPHRSGSNTTSRPRRALYLTYNAASDGDQRARYYADKRAEFDATDGTFGRARVRLSISDDFLGRPVPSGDLGISSP